MTYISDAITPHDILCHERTLLVAGVGSGKNTFFENGFRDKRVLIATSMAAKRNETQTRLTQRDVQNVSCITFSQLATMWRDWCNGKRETGIGGRVFNYDLIVIDEAHALIVDASFANDRVTVLDFLQYGVRNQCVVLCTATPEPLLSSHCLAGFEYHVIDLLDTCRNILPEKVIITTQADFFRDMEATDKQFSYLANARRTTTELSSYLYEKYGKENIRTYNADDRFNENDPTDYLISTSCSREGLNVNNQLLMVAAVETHDPLLAYQFAGRFRNGISTLYVLYDVKQKKVNLDNDNRNGLAMNLAALPADCVQLDNDSLLDVSGGFAYRGSFTDEVHYNRVKVFSILRSNKIKDDFKADPVALFGAYFKNIEYRAEECLASSAEGKKMLREVDSQHRQRFEDYISEIYDKGKNKDNVWVTDDETLSGILAKSKVMNIKNDKDVYFKNALTLMKYFGYNVYRGSRNTERDSYHIIYVEKATAYKNG